MVRARLAERVALTCVLVVALWYFLPGFLASQGRIRSPLASTGNTDSLSSDLSGGPPPGSKPLDPEVQIHQLGLGSTRPGGKAYAVDYDAVPRPVNDLTLKEDKVIVMAKMQEDDTNWVDENLPDWQTAIYTVDNTSAALHAPRNKGREANVYLLYIITNYDNLPSNIVFLHHHRDGWPRAWHNDAPAYDNVAAMNTLRLEFIQKNGYANLRCNWEPGCPAAVQYLRDPTSEDPDRQTEHHMEEVWHHFFGAKSVVPEIIATPCCAQFAVSREQVHKRSREEYMHFHDWLMKTEYEDNLSGRIFEYLWHVIFGQDAVYCPSRRQCYKDVYGRKG